MRALIDCDIFCYEIGCATNEEGEPLDWDLVKWRVDDRIEGILSATKVTSWQGYLTGKDNFRDSLATIRPYKGHRDRSDRPYWYQDIYWYLQSIRNCVIVHGMEADDAIAIEHSKSNYTIACSRDKDFLQLPGWAYCWPGWKQEEAKPHYISEIDGLRFFYSQLLTGDTADNIPGLYNVGSKSASVKRVYQCGSELSMFLVVKDEYEKRFGSYWDVFLGENADLLWLWREDQDYWTIRNDEWFREEEYKPTRESERDISPMKSKPQRNLPL